MRQARSIQLLNLLSIVYVNNISLRTLRRILKRGCWTHASSARIARSLRLPSFDSLSGNNVKIIQ